MSSQINEQSYNKKEITNGDIKIFNKIFEIIEKDKQAYDFLKPVDYVTLDIPDYPEIISKPMDLGTVKKKLSKGEYKTIQDFLDDIDLIWNNCRTYNLPGSDIVKMANHCEKYFKKLMDKYMKNNQNKIKATNDKIEIIKLTSNEKNYLVEKIKEQSNENLTQIIKLILKESPKAIEDVDKEKLYIKLDLLDHKTYEIVINFIDCADSNNIVKALPNQK